VNAAAEGVVIRSDRHYEEFDPEFRKQLLDVSDKLGHTPSDIFEHILLGRSVFIDHGFDLVPGYRAITIYAHLSHIDTYIKPGIKIDAGEQIGLSGNSGTEDGTLGKRTGAHLHWELILQDAGGEYYLGQGWDTEKLYQELVRVFSE
jgi:murein DD-endopeptidase MepM/ murein hydrolase activator NlpD